MAYTKTAWVPRQGTNLNKFTKSAETSTSVILANTPDAVTQAGTPFSVELMNKMEQGIFDSHAFIEAIQNEQAYGYVVGFAAMPSSLQLATWRFLPLAGQVIPIISSYQRLCDMMYVRDAQNPTADWWYKTSDPQGTIRDVNGSYMRVLDHQGLFSRAAGANSKYKMANNAPYDGKAIGAFRPDDNRLHWHAIEAQSTNLQGAASRVNWTFGQGMVAEPKIYPDNAFITGSGSDEAKPASISFYYCIKY
jgi:hypothetical protein